jgi:hypothetical protein
MTSIEVKGGYLKNDIEKGEKVNRKGNKSSREDNLDGKAKRKEDRIRIWTYPNYAKTFPLTVIRAVPVLSADI